MRCPKCGFISFDYLDRCIKCQTDLTGERHKLNLLDITPNPISLETILERMPQMIGKETAGVKETAQDRPPGMAAKTGLPKAGPDISLESLAPLALDLSFRKPEPPKLNSDELELVLEDLEIGPK
jgi:hypothetical protein